jgi:hypothetical protein
VVALFGAVALGIIAVGVAVLPNIGRDKDDARTAPTCDGTAGIRAAELEERVLTGLKDVRLGNEDLIDVFVTEFKAEPTRLHNQRGSLERQTRTDLNKVNTAIKRCLTFITGGDGDPGPVRDELRNLEIRKRNLERKPASAHEERTIELRPNIADPYRKKVMEL